MKVRIGDSLIYLEIENPTNFTINDKQKIQEMINERDIKCAGCGKPLGKNWMAVIHRPKSAFNPEKMKAESKWVIYFFCYDTRVKCTDKWHKKRKK